MDKIDCHVLSKMIYPGNTNEPQYLIFEEDGRRCIATNKDQTCVSYNAAPEYAVAVLSAKLFPINDSDRRILIERMKNEVKRSERFLEKYSPISKWAGMCKDAKNGIARLQKEITRLGEMELPQ